MLQLPLSVKLSRKACTAFLLAFVASCLKKKETQSIEKKETVEEPQINDPLPDDLPPKEEPIVYTDEPTTAVNGGNPPTPIDPPQNCGNSVKKIDMGQVAAAAEIYAFDLKLFGSNNDCLLALHFPKYYHDTIKDIFLLDDQGQMIVHKSIFDIGHIKEDRRLYPIIFDSIILPEKKIFHVLIKTVDQKLLLRKSTSELTFSNTFNEKKAYGLTSISLPISDFKDHQLQALFQPTENQFLFVKEKTDYYKAHRSSKYNPNQLAWSKCIITDLNNNIITSQGDKFSDIIQHNVFICYQLIDQKYYLRTLVRIV